MELLIKNILKIQKSLFLAFISQTFINKILSSHFMVETKMYDNLNDYLEECSKPIKAVLENQAEVKEKIKVGKLPLSDLMVQGLEKAISEISGKYLTEEKEIYFLYRVAFNNTLNDIDFVNYYAGDIQKWLEEIYSKEKDNLRCLNRKDFRDALIIAVYDEKVPGLLDIYKENPHLDLSGEQIRKIRENKNSSKKESTYEGNDRARQKFNKSFFKRIAIMGAIVLGVSTFISYQAHSEQEKLKELETVVQTVEQKYGDLDNDGYISEREKLELLRDIAKQNNVILLNGEFKDQEGDLVNIETKIKWFKNYTPSPGFGKIYGVSAKTLEDAKKIYESANHNTLNKESPLK